MWFGVAATMKEELRVIPLTLLMRTLLALIPDGKQAPLAPDLGKDNARYRETLTELLVLVAAGRIKPAVAEGGSCSRAARARRIRGQGGSHRQR